MKGTRSLHTRTRQEPITSVSRIHKAEMKIKTDREFHTASLFAWFYGLWFAALLGYLGYTRRFYPPEPENTAN